MHDVLQVTSIQVKSVTDQIGDSYIGDISNRWPVILGSLESA